MNFGDNLVGVGGDDYEQGQERLQFFCPVFFSDNFLKKSTDIGKLCKYLLAFRTPQ